MAELFDKDRTVISRHIRNIYKEKELEESITCAKFAHMGSEGDQTYARSIFSSVRRYHPWRASSTTARSLMPTPTSSASSSRPNTPSCSSTTTLMRQQQQLDLQRHNQQYPPIAINSCQHNHDRFLIIDDVVYIFGASLKDAGKKLFAYIRMQETSATELLNNIR